MKPPRASSGMAERRMTPDPCNDHHAMVARARSTSTKGVASAATSGMKATTRSAVGARDAFATEMRSPPTTNRTSAMAYQSTTVVKRSAIQTKTDGAKMPIAPTARIYRPITKARVFTISLARCLTAVVGGGLQQYRPAPDERARAVARFMRLLLIPRSRASPGTTSAKLGDVQCVKYGHVRVLRRVVQAGLYTAPNLDGSPSFRVPLDQQQSSDALWRCIVSYRLRLQR